MCFVLLFKVLLGLEIFQDENWRKFTQFRNRLQEDPLVPSGRPDPWSGMSRDPSSNCTPPWMAVDGRVSLSQPWPDVLRWPLPVPMTFVTAETMLRLLSGSPRGAGGTP